MSKSRTTPQIAIACGGTGGHLFPGLAVTERLIAEGAGVALFISGKEIDRIGVQAVKEADSIELPAIALQRGSALRFLSGLWRAYRLAKNRLKESAPDAVLGMGGFTSPPVIWAARSLRIPTFLHEANLIPGRATRLLRGFVNEVFVHFPETSNYLGASRVEVLGMPVREGFQQMDPASCRTVLGLKPELPVVLVMGGSQGARAINELFWSAWRRIPAPDPEQFQILHLTGEADSKRAQEAYREFPGRVVVRPFLTEMEVALGAASVAISRAGASSLAEFSVMEVPAILIPFPHSKDYHQFYNAESFVRRGAARMMEQKDAGPDRLAGLVSELLCQEEARRAMQTALREWPAPDAAARIANRLMSREESSRTKPGEEPRQHQITVA